MSENALTLAATPSPTPTLALRPRDAARAIGLGQRKLWSLTSPRGPIRCVRIGRAVRYPVASLEEFLAAHVQARADGALEGGDHA